MPWAKSCREGEELPLPKGFVSISDITEEKVKVGSLVNVIGLVKDYRAPIETSGRGRPLHPVTVQLDRY
jgi:hypothetical protein